MEIKEIMAITVTGFLNPFLLFLYIYIIRHNGCNENPQNPIKSH